MTTGRESVCCHDIDKVLDMMEEVNIKCMTMHEGFIGNCLNRYVILTALYAYVQDISPIDDNELPHK